MSTRIEHHCPDQLESGYPVWIDKLTAQDGKWLHADFWIEDQKCPYCGDVLPKVEWPA